MNTKVAFKVQLGDRVKMLAQNTYENLEALVKAAKSSYPKRLADTEIALKYSDNDGDWIYLSEEDDLLALSEVASSLDKQKMKLVIEITKDKPSPQKPNQKKQQKKVDQVEEIKQAMEATTLEEKQETPVIEEKKETEFKELKDFKFAEVAAQIEALLNSEEEVRPGQIMKALRQATFGTKAEVHVKRFLRKGGRCGGKPRHFGKMMKHCMKDKSHSRGKSSSPDEQCEQYFGPFPGAEQMSPFFGFGPMAHPFANGPHYGPHGGCGRRGPKGQRHAMKFFKKFMKSYRSSSSSSSSSESSEERKIRKQQRREQNQKRRQERIAQRQAAQQQTKDVSAEKVNEA